MIKIKLGIVKLIFLSFLIYMGIYYLIKKHENWRRKNET